MIKCDMCGNAFVPGNDADGIPNGVKFTLSDGSSITSCSKCIAKVGEDKSYLMEFLDRREGNDRFRERSL